MTADEPEEGNVHQEEEELTCEEMGQEEKEKSKVSPSSDKLKVQNKLLSVKCKAYMSDVILP